MPKPSKRPRRKRTEARTSQHAPASAPILSLPLEIFWSIASHLTSSELLPILSVSKQWRLMLQGNYKLWTHLDMTFFKDSYYSEGANLLLTMSQNSLKSLDYLAPLAGDPNGNHEHLEVHLVTLAETLRQSPLIETLRLSWPYYFWAPKPDLAGNVTNMELTGDTEPFEAIIPLYQLPQLVSYVPGRWAGGRRLEPLRWKDLGEHDNLKSLRLEYVRLDTANYDTSLHESDFEGLGAMLPALENLEVKICGAIHRARFIKFLDMSNLKVLKLENIKLTQPRGWSYPLPRYLPESLEKLIIKLDKPALLTMTTPTTKPLPYLPRLTHLENNLDSNLLCRATQIEYSSIWSTTLEHSRCRLKTLKIGSEVSTGFYIVRQLLNTLVFMAEKDKLATLEVLHLCLPFIPDGTQPTHLCRVGQLVARFPGLVELVVCGMKGLDFDDVLWEFKLKNPQKALARVGTDDLDGMEKYRDAANNLGGELFHTSWEEAQKEPVE